MKRYQPISLFLGIVLIVICFEGALLPDQTENTNALMTINESEENKHISFGETSIKQGSETFIRPVMTDRPAEPKTAIPDNPPLPTINLDDLPPEFSWTNYDGDWTSPVKDQGSCGSCWAFSAIAIMESSINLASGFPDTDIDLSEQYILSCLPYGGSCGGGWTDDALEAIISTSPTIGNGINGVTTEDCMPYEAIDYLPCSDKCDDWDYLTDPVAPDNKLWELESWGANHALENDNPADINIVKGYLLEYGPLSASMYVDSGFQTYWNSHSDPDDWYFGEDSYSTNHAVELVGWKDDATVTNGGFWRLKNSWGTGFGYGGYFNVAYGGLNIGERIRWCSTTEWPQSAQGPGPGEFDMAIFCDFEYGPSYPHLGEEIIFSDVSDGDVTLREWDFNGDGEVDSTEKNPTYIYYVEGKYNVTLTVTNAWGLESTRTLFIEVRETWPPQPVCNPEQYAGKDPEVSLDARYSYDVDGGRITSYHWDFDDGTTSDESHVTHVFPEIDRKYEVMLTVTDSDGATSSIMVPVMVDVTMPPETKMIVSATEEQDWYRFNKKISFDAEDWTSVSHTYYQIDDGEWLEYKQSIDPYVTIKTEGIHTISYYSIDYYGNEETVKTGIIRIDKAMPTLNISITGSMQHGWYVDEPLVTINGDDALSGLDLIIYKVDNGQWTEYDTSFNLEDGAHRLYAYALDQAGNQFGYEEPFMVNVDTKNPTTICQLIGEGNQFDYYQTVSVYLTSSDTGSGVKNMYYSLDDGPMNEYHDMVEVTTLGNHQISFYAVDALGNEEPVQSRTFSVHSVNFKMILDQPQNFLYLFNVELFGLGRPVIIGPVDIAVEVDCFAGVCADISYVEFLVDGEVMIPDSTEPFVWRLDTPLMGSHEIGVRAVASDGSMVEEFVDAQVFIF